MERLEPRNLASAIAPSLAPIADAAPATVTGRFVFYNNSRFDGKSPRSDSRDDAAVAPDKEALLPGEAVVPPNYTTYARGINGVAVDVAGLPQGAAVSATDFTFRVGNDGAPWAWRPAPAPRQVLVRAASGNSGAARIMLRWRDRAIRNTWLQITVNATANTGLSAPDVFYFGNLVGDAGVGAAGAGAPPRVEAGDVEATAARLRAPAAVDDPDDFDRNGRVTRADLRLARRNLGAELYGAAPFPGTDDPGVGQDQPSPPPLPGPWHMTFHDEFSAAALDPVWHPAQYWDHDLTVVGGGELEAYDPSGISVAGGLLHLIARRDGRHGVPYVSGLVMTGGEKFLPSYPKFSFRYGYMEVRAKFPTGRGLWPAVWLMPASYDDDNGEIDVVEVFGNEPAHARFTLHRRGRDEGHGWDGPDFSEGFHTFAIDWQPDHVAWYVDGAERARSTDPALICPEAMYPILDLAVGGPGAGAPDGATRFPTTMDVDYIRVWQ